MTTFADDVAIAITDGVRLEALAALLQPQLAQLVADPRVAAARRFVFTASGDSLFAATAIVPAFRRWTGASAQVMTSIEFARYEVPLLTPGDVAVGVSNSGNSSRTRETMVLARQRGTPTIGVTGSCEGPLASLVDLVIHRPVTRPERVAPGHRRVLLNLAEYLASLFALYLLGLEVGVARSALPQPEAEAWRGRLRAAVRAVPAAAAAVEPAVVELAGAIAGADTIWCLGSGPGRGTADYAAAKFHEQYPLNGVAQDLEEWAHLQYFLTLSWGPRAVVLVHAPAGNALDRAEEITEGIARAGGRAVVIATPGRGRFPKAMARIDVPPPVDEWLAPILFHLPAQLLVLHLAEHAGIREVPLRRQDDYWLIRKGLVRPSADGLA
jgi:glutamine---fructose-6-phosphate transaminase (isomerizing)